MNKIHPSAVFGPDVELGERNVIGPYVVILGPCRLGDDNWLGPHVTIGGPPEIRGHEHPAWDEPGRSAGIVIGDRNVFREFTCVHQPAHGRSSIGDDCYLMNKVYIAHDTVVGDLVTMASSVTMGGHVQVGDAANLGMGAVVHQRRVVAPGAMVGMGAVITRDVPPYALTYGNPSRVRGVNRVGMQRSGVPDSAIDALAAAYRADASPDAVAGPVGRYPELAEAFAWWEKARGGGPTA